MIESPLICLTFDTDHVDDVGMARFLAETRFPGHVTFFCTQVYSALAGTAHEVAPHPFLDAGSDWQKEFDLRRQQFPDAVSWRSHACVFSHGIGARLLSTGYRYISVFDELGVTGLRPNQLSWGLWHLPIYYMDSLELGRSQYQAGAGTPFDERHIEQATTIPGLYVFDFHPFHLLLNTPDLDFYTAARDRIRAGADWRSLRYPGQGATSFFDALCERMRGAGLESVRMRDAVGRWEG